MANMIKRSEVNRIMREADKFIRSFGYILPPFAYWSPKEFKDRKGEAQMIIDRNWGCFCSPCAMATTATSARAAACSTPKRR